MQLVEAKIIKFDQEKKLSLQVVHISSRKKTTKQVIPWPYRN